MLGKTRCFGRKLLSIRKMIEMASECKHLNDDESKQQGMFHTVTEQKNYKKIGIRKEKLTLKRNRLRRRKEINNIVC